MPKLKYGLKQDYDITPLQKKFENYLQENGFTILGYSYCNSYNGYLIEKDDCEIEYRIYNGKGIWKYTLKAFLQYWDTCAKYHQLTSPLSD